MSRRYYQKVIKGSSKVKFSTLSDFNELHVKIVPFDAQITENIILCYLCYIDFRKSIICMILKIGKFDPFFDINI